MQDTRSEHNAERIALALATVGALFAVLLVGWPRLTPLPTVEEWIVGDVARQGSRLLGLAIGVAAGFLAALAATLAKPIRDRGRSLGIACGGVLAAAVHAVLVARAPGLFETLLSALLVIPLGLAAAALLSDRSLVSLVAAGLVVGAPLAFGRASALEDRARAELLQQVRADVLKLGAEHAYAAFDRGFDRSLRRALHASLQKPHVEAPVALYAVDAGGEEERFARASGYPGVRVVAGRSVPLEPSGPVLPGAAALAARVEMQSSGMPLVRLERPHGRYVLHVLTPLGAHRQAEVDPTAGLTLLDDALKGYLGEIAGLPVGTRVLVRATSDAGASTPWVSLAMPPR